MVLTKKEKIAITFALGIVILAVVIVIILTDGFSKPDLPQRKDNTKQQLTTESSSQRARIEGGPSATGGGNGRVKVGATRIKDEFSCNSAHTRVWNFKARACMCYPPFFGGNTRDGSGACSREFHENDYLAAGNPKIEELVPLPPTQEHITQRLSFARLPDPPESLCTSLCNADDNCQAIIWRPSVNKRTGACTLLLGDVVIEEGKELEYDPRIDSSLIFKKESRPKFVDRVFLFNVSVAEGPVRYWVSKPHVNPGVKLVALKRERIVRLGYKSVDSINNAELTVIFSLDLLTIGETPAPSERTYLWIPPAPLKIPFAPPMYAMIAA